MLRRNRSLSHLAHAQVAVSLFDGNALVDEMLVPENAVTAARLATETVDVVLCPNAAYTCRASSPTRSGTLQEPTSSSRPLLNATPLVAAGSNTKAWMKRRRPPRPRRPDRHPGRDR